MSTLARPSTPASRTTTAAPSTPPTGTWRHPKLDEIVRRRDASTFSERNVRKIKWNTAALLGLWGLGKVFLYILPSLFRTASTFQKWADGIYYVAQVILVYNLLMALKPLIGSKDEITDIPLTPAQRKLLGLAPSSGTPTPGSSYITPPRYARTPTSMSGSPGRDNYNFSDSPLSRKGSPNGIVQSPFSPGNSPSVQKAIGGGTRRHSYGSASPLGPGASRGLETPGTPSPSVAKGGNVGLNSKWLYDKGRRNSGNIRLFS